MVDQLGDGALLGLGVWMLSGREITLMLPKPGRGAPTARLGSMFGYGLAYAIASPSCTIGPFLAVTAGTFRSGSVLDGVLAHLAYATGMALLVGVLAVATALASSTVARDARWLPHINRISEVLLGDARGGHRDPDEVGLASGLLNTSQQFGHDVSERLRPASFSWVAVAADATPALRRRQVASVFTKRIDRCGGHGPQSELNGST